MRSPSSVDASMVHLMVVQSTSRTQRESSLVQPISQDRRTGVVHEEAALEGGVLVAKADQPDEAATTGAAAARGSRRVEVVAVDLAAVPVLRRRLGRSRRRGGRRSRSGGSLARRAGWLARQCRRRRRSPAASRRCRGSGGRRSRRDPDARVRRSGSGCRPAPGTRPRRARTWRGVVQTVEVGLDRDAVVAVEHRE